MIYQHIKNGKYSHIKGEIALVVWIFLASLMSVIVRQLGEYFDTFGQIFLRTFFALFISAFIYHVLMGKLNFKNLNKKDASMIFLRALILFSAIGFYVLAVNNTTIANVGFVGALPTTAIIGIFMLKEKLSLKKLSFLLISLAGILFILVKDIQTFSIGVGESYAVASAFLFSIGFLFRKKISSKVGDKEISLLNTFFTSILAFLVTIIFEDKISVLFQSITMNSFLYLIFAAFVFVGISYLAVYGYKRVSAITGSSIEFLEAVFSLILGYIIFSEVPTLREFVGGILIVLGAYLMMRLSYNNKTDET